MPRLGLGRRVGVPEQHGRRRTAGTTMLGMGESFAWAEHSPRDRLFAMVAASKASFREDDFTGLEIIPPIIVVNFDS
jgi:hypothetical protein